MGHLRRLQSSRAFTLIELLIVILVIGILIAVAAPSFLGQTQKARDSAAKQHLTVAYKAATAWAVDHQGGDTGADATCASTAQGDYCSVAGVQGAITAFEPQLGASAGTYDGIEPVTAACARDVDHEVQTNIVVEKAAGGDLVLCNDPQLRVCALEVQDHVLQPAVCFDDPTGGDHSPPSLASSSPNFSGDNAQFEFVYNDPDNLAGDLTAQCRLQSTPTDPLDHAFTPCSSPVEYSGLSAGEHTFSFKASDPAGNQSVVTDFAWTSESSSESVYFISNRSEENEVWRSPADGSEDPIQVTANGTFGSVQRLALSPDGTTLAILGQGPGDLGLRLYLMDVSDPESLHTVNSDLQLHSVDWSPDSTQLVYSYPGGGGSMQLVLVQPDGGGRTPLSQTGGDPDFDAAFSPDGQQLVYVHVDNLSGTPSIERRNVDDTGGRTSLASFPDEAAPGIYAGAWYGDTIVFDQYDSTDNMTRIYSLSDSGGTPAVISDETLPSYNPDFSATGLVSYTQATTPADLSEEIWAMDANGANKHQLFPSLGAPYYDFYSTW